MASAAPGCTICSKIGLRPLNKVNLVNFYVPAYGVLNYAALSVNVMNPPLLSRLVPNRDITNILLFNSIAGSAIYLYNRPHVKQAGGQLRALYSIYHAVLFNFGSVLIWAVLRSVAPKSNCIATICGLLAGAGLVIVGKDCIKYLDSKIQPEPK